MCPVRLGGADRDAQELRDLLVRVPESQQTQHVPLALRQRVALDAEALLRLGRDQPRSERRIDMSASACHLANRRDDFGVGRLLQHVAGRAGGERLAHVARIVLHREHEHLRLGPLPEQRSRRLDPVQAGHQQVHQDDVRLELSIEGEGIEAVGGLAHDIDVRLGVQQQA